MDHLLHLRVNPDHPVIEIRMIPHQHVRVPCSSNKYCVDAASDWRHEYLADLQSDQERESHNDGRKSTSVVVSWFGELQVEIGQESAEVRYESTAHREYGPDQTVIDKGVYAPIFHHCPRILSCWNVCFTIQSNMGECVAVDKSVFDS